MAEKNRTTQHSTEQRSTAQRRPAQHKTKMIRTAEHRTEQQSTNQHNTPCVQNNTWQKNSTRWRGTYEKTQQVDMTNVNNKHKVERKNKKHKGQVDMKPYKISSRLKQTWQIKTRWRGWMWHTPTPGVYKQKMNNQHHVDRRNLKHRHQVDRKHMKTEHQVYRKPCDKSTPGWQENSETQTQGVQDKCDKLNTRWTWEIWKSTPGGQEQYEQATPSGQDKPETSIPGPDANTRKTNNTRWTGRRKKQ